MNSHNKVKGRAGSTNLNMEKEPMKLSWRRKMQEQLVNAEKRNPHRITPRPDIKIVERPEMVDVNQVPLPDNTVDVFDMLPTLILARRDTLERMKSNKVLTMDEDVYLKNEAQEFDDEVREQLRDSYGNEQSRDRQERADMAARQLPETEPPSNYMPDPGIDRERQGLPPRRRNIDDLERNLI